MTFTPIDVVEVCAWGRTVGAIALDDTSGAYAFEYSPDWLDDPVELAPLHMPARPRIYLFPALSPDTFYRLPPLVADSLPDRFGNALIDSWMAGQGVTAAAVSPLDRLACVADRAMGALEFRPPADTPTPDATALALADLVAAARQALAGELGDDAHRTDAVRQLIAVGTSAGGARAKAVIAYNPDTHQIRSGQLDAPDGFEHWLIKLDGVDIDPTREQNLGDGDGFGRIEFAYHLMATDSGIDMAECRLLPEGPRTHFLTRRFDRTPDGRVHMLSLCGLAHLDFNLAGAHSYEQYIATIDELDLGPTAREQAFRRVVFNVAAVNRDDHTKNLAFLCDRDGTWALSPAFDVTYAHNPNGRWTAHHQMTVGGKADGIGRSDLEALGDRFAVPGYRAAIDEVIDATRNWAAYASTAGVSDGWVAQIAADIDDHRP